MTSLHIFKCNLFYLVSNFYNNLIFQLKTDHSFCLSLKFLVDTEIFKLSSIQKSENRIDILHDSYCNEIFKDVYFVKARQLLRSNPFTLHSEKLSLSQSPDFFLVIYD